MVGKPKTNNNNNKDVRCKKQITKVGAANQLAPATDLEVGDALRCNWKSFSTFQQFVKIQRFVSGTNFENLYQDIPTTWLRETSKGHVNMESLLI